MININNNKDIYISIPNFLITGSDLKNIISKKLNYSVNDILLNYKNNTIEDSNMLIDYHIHIKSIVNVTIKNNTNEYVAITIN